jgi:glycosyltransferase involved in cell wall biosynthesis
MRILKIYDGDYPWDVRVEKVGQTLVAAGHSVRLLCRNRKRRSRHERLSDGLDVCRLPVVPDTLSFPFFLNPVWAAFLISQVRRFRPDRLLVRDLPLALLALAVGRLARIPVIADLAEPYPDSLRSQRQFEPRSTVDRVVRNPFLADQVERLVVRGIDRALVVCPEAGWRLERQGLAVGGWTEVGNTVVLDRFVPRGQPVPEFEGLDGRFLLLFSGLLAGDRGLDVALQAVARLRVAHPGRFVLVIVGEGPVRRELEAQVQTLGLDGDVRFTGWIDHDRLPDVVARASIGILPFQSCPHINSTLANKLFEYMTLGLPVVASDVTPMLRVLKETGAGLSFRSGDAADLARKVELLADDPDARGRCADGGRRAAKETYNWDVDGRRLLEAVQTPARA